MRTICLELAPYNITVNNIGPGAIHIYVYPTFPAWLSDLELQRLRVGTCEVTLHFRRQGAESRWEVREVARNRGAKEEDTIQVTDDPEAAQPV